MTVIIQLKILMVINSLFSLVSLKVFAEISYCIEENIATYALAVMRCSQS